MSTREVVLRPGDFCFAGAGTVIRTLLGSCVAITMWHPTRQVGGMCHYVVPGRRAGAHPRELDGRYADEVVAMFRREIAGLWTEPADYQVKMFGGGAQFEARPGLDTLDVPSDNVATGLRLLAEAGFTVSAHHLGGTGHRNVVFDLTTGDVWLKHVARDEAGPRSPARSEQVPA